MIALLVMTDGRETIHDTLASWRANVSGPVSEWWIHDDTGDPAHAAELRGRYPEFEVVETAGRSGFGGAIRNAWATLRAGSGAPFVFHLEDDFTFNRPVDLGNLVEVLNTCPHLQQLAFRRQPWNDAERAAGGIIEQHPGDYCACLLRPGVEWLEHRRFFTTNPSLYRRELLARDWPEGAQSEGRFGVELFADPLKFAGYWGPRHSPPWVHHIGNVRHGIGY